MMSTCAAWGYCAAAQECKLQSLGAEHNTGVLVAALVSILKVSSTSQQRARHAWQDFDGTTNVLHEVPASL
jgi:hypothetical protein